MKTRKQGRGGVFNSDIQLKRMFTMRLGGETFHNIARFFGVDHSTVIYHCKKHGIIYDRPKKVANYYPGVQNKDGYTWNGEEYVNRGKSYLEYLAMAKVKALATAENIGTYVSSNTFQTSGA